MRNLRITISKKIDRVLSNGLTIKFIPTYPSQKNLSQLQDGKTERFTHRNFFNADWLIQSRKRKEPEKIEEEEEVEEVENTEDEDSDKSEEDEEDESDERSEESEEDEEEEEDEEDEGEEESQDDEDGESVEADDEAEDGKKEKGKKRAVKIPPMTDEQIKMSVYYNICNSILLTYLRANNFDPRGPTAKDAKFFFIIFDCIDIAPDVSFLFFLCH